MYHTAIIANPAQSKYIALKMSDYNNTANLMRKISRRVVASRDY